MLLQLACLLVLQIPQQSLPMPVALPPNGYTIVGQLTSGSGAKPVGMDVSLEVDDGQEVARTVTGANGDFRFDRLRYGRYFVVVEGEKFWNLRERVTIDQGAFDNIRVSFTLKARPGMDSPAASTVSVDALRRPPPPKEAQKEYEKAVEEQQKGQTRKAIEHLQKALKIAPDYYEACLQLGIEQHRAGRLEDAVRLFERAVELNDQSIPARHALGKIYFAKQEFQKSADMLVELTKIGVSDPEIYTLIGATFYRLNAFDRAEEHLLRAVALSPETTGPAHLQLFNVYMRSNRLPSALEQLETYLKRFPDAADRGVIEQQAEKLRQILKR